MKNEDDVKKYKVIPQRFYQVEEGMYRPRGTGKKDYNEKLLDELTHTRKELIKAK